MGLLCFERRFWCYLCNHCLCTCATSFCKAVALRAARVFYCCCHTDCGLYWCECIFSMASQPHQQRGDPSLGAWRWECDNLGCGVCLIGTYAYSYIMADNNMKPEKPSIMGMAEFRPSAKCPRCNLIMYLGNRCPHCDYLLSHAEQEEHNEFWRKTQRKGYILGFVFFILFIFVPLLIWGL